MPQPKNALAPNALNMLPYEAQFNVQDTKFKNRKYADNVYSGLLPELMRAQFPEYIAFSPATVISAKPNDGYNSGEFSPRNRTIALDPHGINGMLMEPYGKYGYIGFGGGNTTTEDTLNALRTMLHESTHARMNLAPGQTRARPHPAEQLKAQMNSDRYIEMLKDIQASNLPSVSSVTSPHAIINEYFATATPVRDMTRKNLSTRKLQQELEKVDYLAKKYPELEKMRSDWERPELFAKD